MPAGASVRAVSTTCCSIGMPATVCSTFGEAERMRLPSPAARMTTCRGAVMADPAAKGRGDSSGGGAAPGVHEVPLQARATTMRGVSSLPDSPAPGVLLQRRTAEAGLLACAAGVVVHRLWQSVPTARVGESLLLGALWAALAWLLRR